MASKPERAHTCKLPSRKGALFLRFNCPDWSKLDIIGQTIILAELTPRFGSFQNVCAALNLQSNEVESFLSTHLQYQQASERGRLIAEQWGRDLAVPADDDEDIPQQRPVLVYPSSIAPACDFLESIGYQEHIQAVRAWSRRTITWPPYIDVTDLNTSRLDQSDINFPAPRKQLAYSRYFGSLGNDSRAIVGFVGAWRPKRDGTPDTRISFINVPDGSMAFGPRGSRQLTEPGRYSVCWRTDSLPENEYNDFVLARNTPNGYEDDNSQPNLPSPRGYQDVNEGSEAELETLNTDQEQETADTTLPADSTVNPKAVFGTSTPGTYNYGDKNTGLFHARDEPQGPSRKLENPQLQQTWSNWPGQIFQFRLPHGYTVLGPLGHILTFDPPEDERYDETGNPHGVGGTYFIVPFTKTDKVMSFKMDDLPADVSFRLKTTENLVFIRNGMVLPGFVEPGVHEWSTRDGLLDFYNARGCYEILQTEGGYNILPGFDRDQLVHDKEHRQHILNVIGNSAPIREAFKTLAPHREWLNRQEATSKRLEQAIEKRARLDARHAREKARRGILIEERQSRQQALEVQEAQERASLGDTVLEDVAISQSVKNRQGRRKHNSNDQLGPNSSAPLTANLQPGDTEQQKKQSIDLVNIPTLDASVKGKVTLRRGKPASAMRRKRTDDDEDKDYKPTTPHPARTRKSTSAQKTPTPKKPQVQCANNVSGAGTPQLTVVPQSRRTRAAKSQVQPENSGSGFAPTRMGQSSAALTESKPRRTAPTRKPIGPLLDAIQANPITEGGSRTALHFSTVPDVKKRETAPTTVKDSRAIGRNKTGFCPIAPKPPVPDEEILDDDSEEGECGTNY